MSIDLTPYTELLDEAIADGSVASIATSSIDGKPDVAPKGSLIVFDRDHLAYWERSRGQNLANLKQSPNAAVMYLNRARGKFLRFYGEASVIEEGPIREQVMARTPEAELNFDPERKGAAVLIRVDRIVDPFGGSGQERN